MIGKIIASCGHELTDEEGAGYIVSFGSYDCDVTYGYTKCVETHSWCAKCAYEAEFVGYKVLYSEEDEEEWFND